MKCGILSLSGVTRTSVKNCFQHRRGLEHCISYIIIRYQPRPAFTTAAMLIITYRSRQHRSPHRTSQIAPQQANIAARTALRRQHRSRQHRSPHRTSQTAPQQATSQPAPHITDSIAAGKHRSPHRTSQTASQQANIAAAPHTADRAV
jgi:hypothetical protein